MFQIAHDNCFIYSIINIKGLTKPIFKGEQPIEDLMFIWANQTAIPYLNWMSMFTTDDTVWYLKEG